MATNSGHKTVDLEAAVAKLGGDQALFFELAELFCNESPKQFAALRSAVASNDATAIRSTAHSLKGSLGIFAASHAANLAARLEDDAAAGRLAVVADAVEELEVEVEAVRAALRSFVNVGVSEHQALQPAKISEREIS